MLKLLLVFILAISPIVPLSFDKDYKPQEQRSLTMCLQGPSSCACCDVFFGDCRKHTSVFVFRGQCSQLDEFIYDMHYSKTAMTEDEETAPGDAPEN